MKRWQLWLRVAIGGTILMFGTILCVSFFCGPWTGTLVLLVLAAAWVVAWIALFGLVLAFVAMRSAWRRFAKPSQ